MYQKFFTQKRLVFGCGNPFFGDDGFGPAVIEYLEQFHEIPEDTEVLDAGTSIRDILFDILLSEEKPEQIIVIDAVDREGMSPGEISEIDVNDIPMNKTSDFSLHQFPTTNMLKELSDATGIDVRVFVVQTDQLPEQVSPGLTQAVQDAVPRLCFKLIELLKKPVDAAFEKEEQFV
ncbi:HyaD2 [Desulfamplus magnetovallimortis]|uniref:HyaD2 n=1 Tax=Desulfamplus magnetovallimortis TaxID=1246637 RepID=A0A1W1HCQ9_9BACT|nr:hydrogenase maturation protease [Desulfamplus magnetovallimortis]SLM30291.1 HyaD2 [Desulfamplus magnetovallimortis]